MPLKVIGKYEMHELIGMGAMGRVYRARDTVLDRFVALKVLQGGPDLEPEIKERFYREARAGARLQHPNLATIYDLGEGDDSLFIAMELLIGADLRTYIEEQRPVPLDRKIELLVQVCDGIAHAHGHQLVHRDIKPSNIFIHQNRQAKILDLGIARLPTSTLTRVGNVLGTPNYMSPEQIQTQPCNFVSDIFSAAIVFYEFLVYSHPFRAQFIPQRIARDAPDSLYDHNLDIPPGLEDLLLKGLAKRPEERIQTADEFRVGFQRILDLMRSPRSMNEKPIPETAKSKPEDVAYAPRVAQFNNLLDDFDDKLSSADLVSARAILEQMRSCAFAAPLLQAKLNECEKRFAYASAALSAKPSHREEREIDTVVLDRSSSSIDTATAGDPVVPTQKPWRDVLAAQTTKLSIFGAALLRRALRLPPIYLLLVGAFVTIATVLAIVSTSGTPIPAQIFIGQAIIKAPGTYLLDGPTASSKKIRFLKSATHVNLLDRITSRTQEWERIQYVSQDNRQNTPAGYVQIENLSTLSSTDPQTAWEFLDLSKPPEAAADHEIEAFTDRLDEFAIRFPTLSTQADLERARLFVLLAHRIKRRNEPQESVEKMLTRARNALIHVPSDDTRDLKTEIESLSAPPPPVVGATEPVDIGRDREMKTLLNRIQRNWNDGDYPSALNLCRQLLQIDPGNASALYWERKIHNSQKIEKDNQFPESQK